MKAAFPNPARPRPGPGLEIAYDTPPGGDPTLTRIQESGLARLNSAGRDWFSTQHLVEKNSSVERLETLSLRPRSDPIYAVMGVPPKRMTNQYARLTPGHGSRALTARRERSSASYEPLK